jgi:DNA modification methylase
VTPYYADPWLTVYEGDCRVVLASLPAESVHTVLTSPPYWGLRDYGSPGQLGLEPTPEEYVANMVAVFREVRRVLRADGTLWLNLGDSYANDTKWGGSSGGKHVAALHGQTGIGRQKVTTGLKAKDLVGIPWRVAFALQADGWYLRSDIIWAKPNPMPESVTDRPTKAHEYLFLLSKSARYYYDADAVREASEMRPQNRTTNGRLHDEGRPLHRRPPGMTDPAGRNLRSVWTVATQPYPGAHFATFPPKLIEPAIKAGTSERGVCPECGAPWERVVERERFGKAPSATKYDHTAQAGPLSHSRQAYRAAGLEGPPGATTIGWRPSCGCLDITGDWSGSDDRPDPRPEPVPATVLDPFAGSGTTGMVAQSLSRRAVLIDLNGEYLTQAMARNRDIPLGLDVA